MSVEMRIEDPQALFAAIECALDSLNANLEAVNDDDDQAAEWEAHVSKIEGFLGELRASISGDGDKALLEEAREIAVDISDEDHPDLVVQIMNSLSLQRIAEALQELGVLSLEAQKLRSTIDSLRQR